MSTQQEPDALPPFVTLSNKLAEIFQLTSQRLKLISESISASIDSKARAIQIDVAASVCTLNHFPPQIQSNYLTAQTRPAASSPQSQVTTATASSIVVPQKRPFGSPSSHPVKLDPNKHFCQHAVPDRGSSTPGLDGKPVESNLEIRPSPCTVASPSNTLDGISDRIGSERLDEMLKKSAPSTLDLASLPNGRGASCHPTVEQDKASHPSIRPSPNLNQPSNLDVPRSTPKRLIERIAAPPTTIPNGIDANHPPVPPITPNASTSSNVTSMDTSHSSDRLPSPRLCRRPSTPSSSSRRRSSSRSSSHSDNDRRNNDRRHHSTRSPSPANSRNGHRNSRYRHSGYHRSSHQAYESYHPPPRSATYHPPPRYANDYPAPRSATYRSRSRSRSTYNPRRRGSMTTVNQSFSTIDDQKEHDNRREYGEPERTRDKNQREFDRDRRESNEDRLDRTKDRREQNFEAYLDDGDERPSYARLISILRSLQSRNNYRFSVTSGELLKEFYHFTQRADTYEERMLAYLYDNPRLMHRYLTVAMHRQVITYRADIERLGKSTIKLDMRYRITPDSNNFRR